LELIAWKGARGLGGAIDEVEATEATHDSADIAPTVAQRDTLGALVADRHWTSHNGKAPRTRCSRWIEEALREEE
jgi:hypothetical protein